VKRAFLVLGRKCNQSPGAGCPILRAFCEGWDTTNLATDRRLSHPLRRTQRMGHPPFRGASCRAKHQPRLNREIVSSQKAAHASMVGAAQLEIRGPSRFLRRVGYNESQCIPSSIQRTGSKEGRQHRSSSPQREIPVRFVIPTEHGEICGFLSFTHRLCEAPGTHNRARPDDAHDSHNFRS
jgi:hypothetical protein